MTRPIYLIGGGRAEFAGTVAPFIPAATAHGRAHIAVVALDEGAERVGAYLQALTGHGAHVSTHLVLISHERGLTAADLAGCTGILVCGGLTPAYQEILCTPATAELLRTCGLPYAGYSAGSAIAAPQAVVGGWQLVRDGATVPIAAEETSEDLDPLTVRPGLGLVPFAVDVHATQWGTPTRLLHAVNAGQVNEGWAIDEHTGVCVVGQTATIWGRGSVYRMQRRDGGVQVTILRPGDSVAL